MTAQTVDVQLDPIDFAVIRNGLLAAADQTFLRFKRTAMLPAIYDAQDFAVSFYDDRFNLVATASAMPLMGGALGKTVEFTVDSIGAEKIRPGDVLLTNLQSLTGSHPPDAVPIEPIFFDGAIVGFMALRAHMGDLGAQSVYPTDTTDCFQEGLLLPPLKLYREGVLDETVMQIIRTNSRLPVATAGDFLAGAAAVQSGGELIRGLIAEHGVEVYYAAIERLLDHGETLIRSRLEQIPDGVYTAEANLDDNGTAVGVPVPLKVTITIAGSDITIDTTGSAPQQFGAINCPFAYTYGAACLALKTVLQSDMPTNTGEQRPLTVIAPEGSLFNPGPEAASYVSWFSVKNLTELILTALAPALPELIPAQTGGEQSAVLALLRQPKTGRWGFTFYCGASGFGARRGADGPSALFARIDCDMRSIPAEVDESRNPVVRHVHSLDSGSGGAGTWRGGLGSIVEEEYLAPGQVNLASDGASEHKKIDGLAGGRSPKWRSSVRLTTAEGEEFGTPRGKQSNITVTPGSRYRLVQAGGGGYGDPWERDIASVADDLRDQYISAEDAREEYGAVLDGDGRVDVEASVARRAAGSLAT